METPAFIKNYADHFKIGNDLIISSHTPEVCQSIAREEKPLVNAQYLGIGGKANTAQLLFSTAAEPVAAAFMIDFGFRFRLLVKVTDTIEQPKLFLHRATLE